MSKERIGHFVKQMIKTGETLISFITAISSILIIAILFQPISLQYLQSDRAIGGDYFNALTYLTQLTRHLPFPPSGWLSFWHEGNPVIGSYPTFIFYLMIPFTKLWDAAQVMEVFTIYTHLFFLITAFLSFRVISGSSPVSLILTLILLKSPATFYQLFGEGQVSAASVQWLLPVAILFLYLFVTRRKFKYLLASSMITGISTLLHPALGILTVVIPLSTWLIVHFARKYTFLRLFLFLTIFIILLLLIANPSIYSMMRQFIGKAGSGACASPQCWGMYPAHFSRWFTPLTPLVFTISVVAVGIVKLVKKSAVNLRPVGEPLIAFGALSLYVVASYLQLVNGLASAIFPRRIFWALNLWLLVVAACCYRLLTQAYGTKGKYTLKVIMVGLLVAIVVTKPTTMLTSNFDTAVLFNRPGTVPDAIDSFIVPKYKSHELSQLIPEWVIQKGNDTQYRFDSLNQDVNHWWNVVFAMPAVRGYSNNPTGINAGWFYYFQVGTAENKPTDESELVRNRTLFLIDHYAVGLYEDSTRAGSGGRLGYPTELLADSNLFSRKESTRELVFFDLASEITSPIVFPTEATPIFVISDQLGYETIVRALSNTGLTSKQLVTVKGPQSLDQLTVDELNIFPALIFYRFQGKNWQKLDQYIKNGGTVFIELSSQAKEFSKGLPEFFPATNFSQNEVSEKLVFKDSSSEYLRDVKPNKFASFSYQGGPWETFSANSIRPETVTVLETDKQVFLLTRSYGKGNVIVSGLNLPFHIVDTNNFEEIKLLKNIISPLSSTQEQNPAQIYRNTPEKIYIKSPSRGIYFKENYDRGWTAKTTKTSLTVYPAGLQFMYIPRKNSQEAVTLQYKGTSLTWGLFLTSSLTLLLTFISLWLPKWVFDKLGSFTIPVIKFLQKPLEHINREENDEY